MRYKKKGYSRRKKGYTKRRKSHGRKKKRNYYFVQRGGTRL